MRRVRLDGDTRLLAGVLGSAEVVIGRRSSLRQQIRLISRRAVEGLHKSGGDEDGSEEVQY